jgi:hypothetical protein
MLSGELVMMIRTQIQLTERQMNALKILAQKRKVSVAELIRQGVDLIISGPEPISDEERIRRALSIVGKYSDKDGATDVSVNHDKYLADIYGS